MYPTHITKEYCQNVVKQRKKERMEKVKEEMSPLISEVLFKIDAAADEGLSSFRLKDKGIFVVKPVEFDKCRKEFGSIASTFFQQEMEKLGFKIPDIWSNNDIRISWHEEDSAYEVPINRVKKTERGEREEARELQKSTLSPDMKWPFPSGRN